MRGAKQIVALGAFLLGAVNAHNGLQHVETVDAATGQKHVGCYYGVWAYTRYENLFVCTFLALAKTILLDLDWVSFGLRTLM